MRSRPTQYTPSLSSTDFIVGVTSLTYGHPGPASLPPPCAMPGAHVPNRRIRLRKRADIGIAVSRDARYWYWHSVCCCAVSVLT
eukprot:1435558-Rhodomonas_salina.3